MIREIGFFLKIDSDTFQGNEKTKRLTGVSNKTTVTGCNFVFTGVMFATVCVAFRRNTTQRNLTRGTFGELALSEND